MNSCETIEPPIAAQNPIISFYYGIDPWTYQKTFIYSDTTIVGTKRKYIRANFAASGVIKNILVKNNNNVLYDKTIENSTSYNHTFQIELAPISTPETYILYFKVEDYNGKIDEKILNIKFK
ncbi:MAG: hypothetical protein IT243_08965 [Bacteroidia bacterium]|nr:hypothetical protein [Bacteroidia bacterium]